MDGGPTGGRGGRPRGVGALVIWLSLLGVVGPALVLGSLSWRFQPALAVQAVVIAHTAIGLSRVLTDRGLRVVAFGFWLFSYIWLGLAPLAMLVSGQYPWAFRTTQHNALISCVIVEAGLMAYSAGTALGARFVRAGRTGPLPMERLLGREIAPVRLLLLCVAALGIAVVLVPRQGGLEAFFTSRQALSTADGSDSGGSKAGAALASWGLSVPAFWALLGLTQVPRVKGGDRLLRGLRWLALPVILALNAVVNNPISNPRFWAGTVLLTLAFSYRLLRRPRGFRTAAAALLAVILLVFPYSDYFRYTHREQIHVVSLADQFTTNGDYDAYQQIETGLAFQHARGFQPARAVGPPLFWFPRTLWPGKPQDTGVDIAKWAGYKFTNLSSPLWIESYLWAGLPAVALVFLLLGAVGRRIDTARDRLRDRSGTLAAMLVPGFGFYQLILLRGSLLAATAPMALLIVVPLLISRRAAPAPPDPPDPGTGVSPTSASSAPRRALV